MNAKSVASGATAAIVPGAVIVGTALMVQAFAGLAADRDQWRAQAQARPTVTVTPSAPPSQAQAPTSAPTPEPAPVATVVGVMMTAGRLSEVGAQGGMGSSSEASPSPTPTPQECPRGQLLTINLPLGLLSCDSAVIGGRDPQPTEGQ